MDQKNREKKHTHTQNVSKSRTHKFSHNNDVVLFTKYQSIPSFIFFPFSHFQ